MWYISTMKYYSALKKNEILPLDNTDGPSQIALLVNLPHNAGEARDMGLILGWEDPLE